jgi:voltage-gated potassium channel
MRAVDASGGTLRRLRWLAVALLAIFVYGIVGYLILGFDVIEAIHMTAAQLTTTGFASTRPLTAAEQVFTTTVAVLGVIVFLAILAVVVQAFVEGQLGAGSRRRRMQRRIDDLRNHYIVCAYGRVGRSVARELEAEGVPFVVIEVLEELEEQLRSDGILYLIADPTKESVLKAAGIVRAKALVCAVDSDERNVYITLTGRSLNPDLFIVARASRAESSEQLQRAGANRVVSPYATSGRHMALLALRPRVVDTLDVAGTGGVRLDELRVEPGSPLVGRTLGDACGGAVPLLVARSGGDTHPNPAPELRLEEGDLILVFGEPAALSVVEGA